MDIDRPIVRLHELADEMARLVAEVTDGLDSAGDVPAVPISVAIERPASTPGT